MCGRFTQFYTWQQVHDYLNVLGPAKNLRPRYNIAPTTTVDVVRQLDAGRELSGMRWGVVPMSWKQPLAKLPATFNARAGTITEKPMWRSLIKKQRCIVPASGFYEWTGAKGDKQPHHFTAGDGAPMLAFAGLWDRWRDPEGDELLSATIIVSGASQWMNPYHDRMPVILEGYAISAWLDGSAGVDVLRPARESALQECPVSKRVNRVGNDDDPSLIDQEAA